MIKRLIINADDFGLHEHINEGIIESHLYGCVTSTTIMAGGGAFNHAVDLAGQCPQLSVGVHLTLVGANPVAEDNNGTLLTREGTLLPNYQEFVGKYLLGAVAPEHIEHELRCQIRKVADSGICISHLDSHQHLHVLPGMPKIIVKLAREFQISRIRMPAEPCCFFKAGRRTIGRILSRSVLTGCAVTAGRRYREAGLSSPQHFFGMLAGGAMNQMNLRRIIESLPQGTSEIMVHPANNNDTLQRIFSWNYLWRGELEALKSEDVSRTLREQAINLINYWELCK